MASSILDFHSHTVGGGACFATFCAIDIAVQNQRSGHLADLFAAEGPCSLKSKW